MGALFELDFKVTLPFILSIVALAFTWWRTRDRNIEARFKEHAERLDRHSNRIDLIDHTLRDMPQRQDLHNLQITLVQIEGQLGRMEERLKPVAAIAERMQEVLIERGGK